MSLDSQSVGTSYKQSAVDLDFELRLASFYLSLFLKSELGHEVNNSEIKSHWKSICICDSVGIVASPSEEFPASIVKKEGTHEVICVAYELVRRRRTVPEKPIDDPRVDLIAYVAGPLAFGIFPVLPCLLIHILMFVWKVQAEKQEVKRPSNFVDFYVYLFQYYLNEEKQKSIDIESIFALLDFVLELSLPAKLKVVGLVAVVVKSLIDDLSRIGIVLNTSEQNNVDNIGKYCVKFLNQKRSSEI